MWMVNVKGKQERVNGKPCKEPLGFKHMNILWHKLNEDGKRKKVNPVIEHIDKGKRKTCQTHGVISFSPGYHKTTMVVSQLLKIKHQIIFKASQKTESFP